MTDWEVRARIDMLQADGRLLALHKALVQGDLMSDDEFWRPRQDLLRMHIGKLQARTPASVPIPDSKSQARIFDVYPHVKAMHDAQVVHKKALTEGEFWAWFRTSKTYGDGSRPTKNPFDSRPGSVAESQPAMLSHMLLMQELRFADGMDDDAFETVEPTSQYQRRATEYLEEMPTAVDGKRGPLALMHQLNRESILAVSAVEPFDFASFQRPQQVPRRIVAADDDEETVVERSRKLRKHPLPTDRPIETVCVDGLSRATGAIAFAPIAPVPLAAVAIRPLHDLVTAPSVWEGGPDVAAREDVLRWHMQLQELLMHFWSVMPPLSVERRAIAQQMVDVLRRLRADYRLWLSGIAVDRRDTIDRFLSVWWRAVDKADGVWQEVVKKSALTSNR